LLAGLYIGYVLVLAKLKPSMPPPLAAADRHVPLPPHISTLAGGVALRGAGFEM